MLMNVCSLRNKFESFKAEIKLHNYPDILVVCESRLTNNITDFFDLQGYSSHHTTRHDGYGGISIYVKENLSHQVYTNISTIERVHISRIKLGYRGINIFCVYRAPRSDMRAFLDLLDESIEKFSNIIVCGDMNINLLENEHAPNHQKYRDIISGNGCSFINKIETQHFTFPINNGPGAPGSILDHFLTDMTEEQYFLKNVPSIGDHHCLILYMKTDKNIQIREQRTLEHKHNHRITIELLKYLSKAANDSLTKIHQEFQKIININTSTKVISDKTSFPWIDEEILRMMKIRDALYAQSLALHLTPLQRFDKRERFKMMRNRVTNMIRKKRNTFINESIQEAMANPTKMWQAMKLIFDKKKSGSRKDLPEKMLNAQGLEVDDEKQILNTLNEHFASVGKKLNDEQFRNKGGRTRCHTQESQIETSIYLHPTNENELYHIISSLKNDAAAGLDKISTRNLKSVIHQLSKALVKPVNESLASGTFPVSFKVARVKALYKGKGSKSDPSNYRPISVLSNLSKIFEKLLYQRIYDFLDTHSLIATNQFGFLPKSNTTTATLHAISRIKQSLDSNRLTAAAFVDIAKAFDSVKHELLLEKLDQYGIRGVSNNLIQDYLFGRQQMVISNDHRSEKQYLSYGIPQGSSLSSLLFLIYINDCTKIQLHSYIQLYADDAILIFSAMSAEELQNTIQEDLTSFDTWAYNNYLTFNASKTKIMRFKTSNSTSQQISVIINGTPVEEVSHMVYLGLVMDEKLNWKNHFTYLKSKLSPFIFVLRRARYDLPLRTKLSLYYSYIHSHLTYLVSIWGFSNTSLLESLQRVQNKSLRSIFWPQYRSGTMSTQQLYTFHRIPRIEQLRSIDGMSMIHKIKHGMIRNNLTLKTFEDFHQYNTRNRHDFVIPKARTNIMYRSLLAAGLSEYNHLPNHIKRNENFATFKKHLKTFILAESS